MSRNKWNDRERLILEKIMKAKRRPYSGALPVYKEDAASENILYQLKSTESGSISVKELDILNLINHARAEHKHSAFVLDYVNGPLLLCATLQDFVKIAEALVNEGVLFIKDEKKDEIEVEL